MIAKRIANRKRKNQSKKNNTIKPIWGAVTRALIALILLGFAGIILVYALGKPKTVQFNASFKCQQFSPGSKLQLDFENCSKAEFHTKQIIVPNEAYLRDTAIKDDDICVSVLGDNLVTANLQAGGMRIITINLQPDDVIVVSSPKKEANLGEFKIISKEQQMTMSAWGFVLTTFLEYEYAGFGPPHADTLTGRMDVNMYDQSQGSGGPPDVQITVPKILGPVNIFGSEDQISGWRPISIVADSLQKPISLGTGQFLAENLTSFRLSINDDAFDVGTKIESIQAKLVKADITKLVLYQDRSADYIEIVISGKARSIKLDNKEAIESIISRLISQPSYKTGIAGLLFLFIITAGGIFLKRALEILADAWLPNKNP